MHKTYPAGDWISGRNREINRSLMKKGLEMGYGKAAAYLEAADSAARAQLAVGAASWARMAGVPLPAATATGSGNQGITLSLTIDAAALFFNSTKEQMLRALALGHLVNLLAKSYIGSLAPVCSSGIASGAGAAAAVAWLLGGTEAAILGSIQNMLGGIGGMLCDGAKAGMRSGSGCYAAVTAAYLSIAGCHVAARDGVCSGDIHGLFETCVDF
ncbi:MAG: L-serine ammonia-lyase, iron-sulfur-dependent, subunit alpha [Ruthenibacterium lactatiformans]